MALCVNSLTSWKSWASTTMSAPGVSAFCGAAAALRAEYTLPNVSQDCHHHARTRTHTRAGARVHPRPRSPPRHHGAFSQHLADQSSFRPICSRAATRRKRPAAVVYKATWPEEKIFRCTVGTLHDTVAANGLTKTSLIVVGGCLGGDYLRSLLYDPSFTTEFREATK